MIKDLSDYYDLYASINYLGNARESHKLSNKNYLLHKGGTLTHTHTRVLAYRP